MSKIFISYRRTDTDIVGRLTDRLILEFGEKSVFLDVDNIPIGKDFRTVIDDAINQCQCLVVVIGEGWVRASEGAEDKVGSLKNENDFVRLEVKSALMAKLPIIPVLVGEVNMPDPDTLPEDIRDIAFINATRIRSGRDFRQDIECLVNTLRLLVSTEALDQSNINHEQQIDLESHINNTVNFSMDQLVNQPESLINEKIGRYILKEFITSGGGGSVYRAIDSNLSRTVCLKVAFPMRKDVENLKNIISKSIKGLVQMQHNGVVEIFDFDSFFLSDQQQTFFISMQLEQGVDLNQWCRSLSFNMEGFREKIQCAIQICRILNDAHNFCYIDDDGLENVGVLHGDIKPNNIIVNNDKPRLLDFMLIDIQALQNPLVRLRVDTNQGVTMAFGTPNYMAPEQEKNGIVSRKTDIYSLGVTLSDIFNVDRLLCEDSEVSNETICMLINLIGQCRNEFPEKRPNNMLEIHDILKSILKSTEVKSAQQETNSLKCSTTNTFHKSHEKKSNVIYCYCCGESQKTSDKDFKCTSCKKFNSTNITSTLHSCGHFSPLVFNYCSACGELS